MASNKYVTDLQAKSKIALAGAKELDAAAKAVVDIVTAKDEPKLNPALGKVNVGREKLKKALADVKSSHKALGDHITMAGKNAVKAAVTKLVKTASGDLKEEKSAFEQGKKDIATIEKSITDSTKAPSRIY